jgi:hypothetical protein
MLSSKGEERGLYGGREGWTAQACENAAGEIELSDEENQFCILVRSFAFI